MISVYYKVARATYTREAPYMDETALGMVERPGRSIKHIEYTEHNHTFEEGEMLLAADVKLLAEKHRVSVDDIVICQIFPDNEFFSGDSKNFSE